MGINESVVFLYTSCNLSCPSALFSLSLSYDHSLCPPPPPPIMFLQLTVSLCVCVYVWVLASLYRLFDGDMLIGLDLSVQACFGLLQQVL